MYAINEVPDEAIRLAERLLLPQSKTFDSERQAFIQNFTTLDLQAVPGSGKTTVLLAKLIILEQHLPFVDGSGVLVLSHTNAAIERIKGKIGLYCPFLFAYPNFIGTIQSFVNRFLTIPYYSNVYSSRLVQIDSDAYRNQLNKEFFALSLMDRKKLWGWGQRFKTDPKVNLDNNELISKLSQLCFDEELNVLDEINGKIILKNHAKPSPTYEIIKTLKVGMYRKGYLGFDDAYFLAQRFIHKYPQVKKNLQKRFRYVFVDEMQDMDKHQYDLLEELFYDEGNAAVAFQRIGDKNQSIFNGEVKLDNIWKDRPVSLSLTGSHRLSESVATVVNNFALYGGENFHIIGLHQCEIKPHIILYDDQSIHLVIRKFAEIIDYFVKEGKIPLDSESCFTAIAWNTEWKEQNDIDDPAKIRLSDFTPFNKQQNRNSIEQSCLQSYFYNYDQSQNTFKHIYTNLLNALLKILRLENVLDLSNDRNFSQQTLLNHISQVNPTFYEQFKLVMYDSSLLCIRGEMQLAFDQIRSYLPNFLKIFASKIDRSAEFINCALEPNSHIELANGTKSNTVSFTEEFGFSIELASVHSVKGHDHTATLYLESSYYGDYESKRLAKQFCQIGTAKSLKERESQSMKMVYVGLSRPTHLLCVAIHKDRFQKHLETHLKRENNSQLWEIKSAS